MSWMLYAAVAAGALAAADVLMTMAAGKVANSLGMLIYGDALDRLVTRRGLKRVRRALDAKCPKLAWARSRPLT